VRVNPAGRRPTRDGGRRPALVRGRPDRGSVLLLVPAALLVVLVLASVAVDMALVHLRHRQAHDLAAAAANDAAGAAADPVALRAGTHRPDPARAAAVARQVVAASQLADDVVGAPIVRVRGDQVEVEVRVEADYVFAGVVPGAPDGTTVTARASATLRPGPGG
jgi:hypothetical protein